MSLAYRIGHRFFSEIARGFFDYRALGREHIGIPGGALIVCNHVSFIDPPAVGIAFDEPIYYLARKTLFGPPVMRWLLPRFQAVPVDQEAPGPASLKTVMRLLREEKKVVIFPEGNRSEDGRLQKPEAGVGLVIARAGVPVIPARIFGAFEALPRHRALPRPARVTVVFGRPWKVDPAACHETGKELFQKLAAESMQRIAELTL